MNFPQIEQHSRTGRALEMVASLFFMMAIAVGFVSIVIGLMFLTDALRGTWFQLAVTSIMYAAVVMAVVVLLRGFINNKQEQWSPKSLTAVIVWVWCTIQPIIITKLVEPDSVAYKYRFATLMAMAAVVCATLISGVFVTLHRKIQKLRSDRDQHVESVHS